MTEDNRQIHSPTSHILQAKIFFLITKCVKVEYTLTYLVI